MDTQMWSIHAMEYLSAIKGDEELIDANNMMDKQLVHQKAKAKLLYRVSGHVWRGGKES